MPDQTPHQTDTPATDEIQEAAAADTDEELSTEELEGISGGSGRRGSPLLSRPTT